MIQGIPSLTDFVNYWQFVMVESNGTGRSLVSSEPHEGIPSLTDFVNYWQFGMVKSNGTRRSLVSSEPHECTSWTNSTGRLFVSI